MSEKKTEGIKALNQDFIRYEQVNKPQSYHLAEIDREDEFDDEFEIKTLDIGRFLHGTSTDKSRFASDLGTALQEIGFAILTGHGIDPALYDEAEARVPEIFTRPGLGQKLKYQAERVGSVSQGYFPIKHTSDIHPDLVEGWVFGRRAFDLGDSRTRPFRAEDYWPVPELEPFFRKLCLEHLKLLPPLVQSVLMYLDHDPHLFDEKIKDPSFALRLNYYPPITSADDASGAGRLLGHEDVTLFTILPAPRVEGLQVLNRRNFKWIRLSAPRGSIIINTGDYMQRITNDILPSTTHRVSKPRDPSLKHGARVSFPINTYLKENELLEVLPGIPDPKYEPVKAITFHTRTTSKYYGDDYAVEETVG